MIESTFDIGGAVVFWTAAEFTDRSRRRPRETQEPPLRPATA